MNRALDYSLYTKEQLVELVESLQRRQKYGLVWDESIKEDIDPTAHASLVPRTDMDVRISGETHLMVRGENYYAIKALLPEYKERVDVIYIDPPYNTGKKDFRYNDAFVAREDGYRHSKWLTFMRNRLLLAKQLMSDDGVIFISIDDNEYANLKLLCDSIFGAENSVGPIIWKSGGGKNDSKYLATTTEYVLIYVKPGLAEFVRENTDPKPYKHEDERGRYAERRFDMQGLAYSKSLDYPIEAPDGSFVYPGRSKEAWEARQRGEHSPKDWCWTLSREEYERRKADGRIVFRQKSDGWHVYYKSYYEGKTSPFKNLYTEVTYAAGDSELKEVFHGRKVFEHPKPTRMVKDLIKLHPKKDAFVLDFFAGSGTTGHAVLALNAEEKDSRRRFILITNNENNIFDEVTYPRIKRVACGYEAGSLRVEGFGGNIRCFDVDVLTPPKSNDARRSFVASRIHPLLAVAEGVWELAAQNDSFAAWRSETKLMAVFYDPFSDMGELWEFLGGYDCEKVVYALTYEPGATLPEIAGATVKPIPESYYA